MYADLLVHVVDVSRDDWYDQARAVYDVLDQIGAGDKPIVTALNKIDLAPGEIVAGHLGRLARSVAISARTGEGLDQLLRAIEELAPEPVVRWRFTIPYTEGHVRSWIHTHGRVLKEEYAPAGVVLVAELARSLADRVRSFRSETDMVE